MGQRRQLDQEAAEKRRPTISCAVRGCAETTSGCKPLCSKHVMGMPYAAALARKLEERAREVKLAAQADWRAIDVEGCRAREIRELLAAHAFLTFGGIAKLALQDLSDEHRGRQLAIVGAYVRALKIARLVDVFEITDEQGRIRRAARLHVGVAVPEVARGRRRRGHATA